MEKQNPINQQKSLEPAEYESVWVCYLSGQISEKSWDEHLQDAKFKAYAKARQADRMQKSQ